MSRKVCNIYGQVYGFVKQLVTSIDEVYPGDHLAYERVKLYWHHVIVEDVDHEANEVHIIHYYNSVKEFFETTVQNGSLAKVMRSTIKFWPKRFYHIIYDASEVYPPEIVLENAIKRLGEAKYNPLTQNCEHFCTECKIGKSISIQVHSLVENVMVTVLPTLTRGMLEFLLKKSVKSGIEEFIKRFAKEFAGAQLAKLSQIVFRIALLRCIGYVGLQVTWVSLRQSAYVIVQEVVIIEAKKLCKTGAREILKNAGRSLVKIRTRPDKSSGRRTVCRMKKSGVLAGVAVELLFVGKDLHDASVKKNEGIITKKEYQETAIKRVVGATVSTPMSLAGSVMGQYLLPVPGVGNMVGGITGSAAGRVVGTVVSTGLIKSVKLLGKYMNMFS